MLLLILAHRNMSRLVGEDIRRHQVRIGVETDGRVLAILARLLLELGHAVEPAKPRHAIEYPGELRMSRRLTLIEDGVLTRIDSGGDESRRNLPRLLLQLLWILPGRNRMHIDDAVDAVETVLQLNPVPDGAEIIAEMEICGGLDAREDALRRRVHRKVWTPRFSGCGGGEWNTPPECGRVIADLIDKVNLTAIICRSHPTVASFLFLSSSVQNP